MVLKDVIFALIFILFCSISLIAQKIALHEVSVYLMSLIRIIVILPCIICIKKQIPKNIGVYFLGGIFWNVINCIFIGLALQKGIKISISSIMIQTNSFFSIIFSYIFFKEKFHIRNLIGILISSLGIFRLSDWSIENLLQGEGIIYLLISSLSWGLGFNILKKYKIGKTFDDTIWLSIASLIPFLISIFILDQSSLSINYISSLSIKTFICICIAGLLSTVVGTFIWLKLGHKYTALTLMPFMYLIPVFSSIIAWLFLDEVISLNTAISSLIIFLGIIISQGWLEVFFKLHINKLGR